MGGVLLFAIVAALKRFAWIDRSAAIAERTHADLAEFVELRAEIRTTLTSVNQRLDDVRSEIRNVAKNTDSSARDIARLEAEVQSLRRSVHHGGAPLS